MFGLILFIVLCTLVGLLNIIIFVMGIIDNDDTAGMFVISTILTSLVWLTGILVF